MTSNDIILTQENVDKLVNSLGKVMKAAMETEASPEDAINVIDEVVDILTSLREAIPGGAQQAPEEKETEVSSSKAPGEKQDPSEKGAQLEKDTVEESREKVNEQNSAQLALKNKTYTAKDVQALEDTATALKTRVAELEQKESRRELEQVAEEYSQFFPAGLIEAKRNEVLNSEDGVAIWQDRIAVIQDVQGNNSVKPAKNTNEWIPQKNARLGKKRGLKYL